VITDHLLAEIEAGEGEPLTRLARRVPSARQGRPVTLSCILRWVLRGVPLPDGGRVKLEAVRLAGKWISSPGALRRFIIAQTPDHDADRPAPPRPPGRRQQASGRARDELAAAGWA
jgi:hypothetical protein